MAIESRDVLKTYFEAGDVPTEEQFGNLIDSFISRIDDGVYIFDVPGTDEKRFGVGIEEPIYPLGIQASGTFDSLISLHNTSGDADWLINLLPDGATDPGLNIEQQTAAGGQSRLFINGNSGNVGIGTLEPDDQLHIETSTPTGLTAVKVLNTASAVNQGWVSGQLQDSVSERDGSYVIFEDGPDEERVLIRPGGNVGINEPVPDTTLHVSKPVADVDAVISLVEGTGIATIGPITNNVAMDFEGIQSRSGEYVGDVLDLETSTLNIQRLGGDILIHGDDAIEAELKVIIQDDASMGLGTLTPAEKLDINGAIRMGTTTNDNSGTIRWTGTDFEGRTDTDWLSLTAGGGKWVDGPDDSILYIEGTAPRVGIGTDNPLSTLYVNDTESVTQGNTAATVVNQSSTTSSGENDNRIGLEISCSGTWGGFSGSKNVGLYVSEVTGQTDSKVNLAAVLNGNVAIGHLDPMSDIIGDNGVNVLAIQNGTAPTTLPGVSSTQLYAQDLDGHSTLHIMRDPDEIIKIYRESALTSTDTSTLPDSYDSIVMGVINNLRDRVDELESRLQSIGFIE